MLATEVCVVGAGPGGCTTAIALAQLGIDCILVDKAVFPRHKACGEVITSNCIRELASLDGRIFEDFQQADFNFDIKGNTFVAPNQYKLDIAFKSPANEALGLPHCYTATRYDFDHFLIQSVKKYYPKTKVIEGCHLNSFQTKDNYAFLSNKNGEIIIKSRLVIFANGAGSALTKRVTEVKKRPKHEAIGLRAYYKNVLPGDAPELAEFYFFQKKYMPYGVYITPLKDGLVNVNAMFRKDIAVKRDIQLRPIMNEFIKSNPELKERFKNAELIGKDQGCALELGSRWWEVSGAHYMLVGDAAGLIDATNANGMGHAMISGRIAAEHAKKSLLAENYSAIFLKAYDKSLQKRMFNALKISRIISPFLNLPFFPTFSTWLFNYWMKKSTNSQLIIQLMYSKNAAKDIVNPRFYYNLIFK